MFKKKIKVNTSLLIFIVIYLTFIGILYFRMKNAEKMLADYSDAQICRQLFDCREVFVVEVLDYGTSKISFQNYGPKGIPLDSGTFEEYQFRILGDSIEERTVKVLPNLSVDESEFDIENTYIPSSSDQTIANQNFLADKVVSVEVWRNKITFIFINPSNLETEKPLLQESDSINPQKQIVYEMAMPTDRHPLISAEFAKRDFNGWGVGVLFMIVSVTIFGLTVSGLFLGLSWLIQKIMSLLRKR